MLGKRVNLTDLPKGTSFIAKQVGLQLSNPKLESPVGDNSFAPPPIS